LRYTCYRTSSPEKLATFGAALRLEPGARGLDLGSGSGEMLCTWARDHGITGVGMSQSFAEQARPRAEKFGVADRVEFIHVDAADYVADETIGVAACLGSFSLGDAFRRTFLSAAILSIDGARLDASPGAACRTVPDRSIPRGEAKNARFRR